MSRILLDSTVFIDLTRGVVRARTYVWSVVEEHELWSITPVRTELLAGVRPNEAPTLRELFAHIQWLDVTVELADAAGALAARYAKSHKIGTVDVLLAAAAIELGGTVATLIVHDFPMFPGLQPPY